MKLCDAIKICHAGKYRTLDVRFGIKEAYWNPDADNNYQEYLVARDFLHSRYSFAEKILLKLGII